MSNKHMEEINGLSDDELTSKAAALKETLWKTRIENFSNQLDDTAKIRKLRREIARVKTLMQLRGLN